MIDLNLRATTREELDLALGAAGVINADGQPTSTDVLIDYIGPITRQAGTDSSGAPLFETFPEYHANLRLLEGSEPPPALVDLTIPAPGRPHRTWA